MSNRTVDWSAIPDVGDFNTLPNGEYLAEVTACEVAASRDGDEQWNLKFKACGGDHDGEALFDNITFSDKGISRCKLVIGRLGYDVSGPLNLDVIAWGSEDGSIPPIVGRRVYVTLTKTTRKIEATGQEVDSIKVPYSGYRRTEENGGAPAPVAAAVAAVASKPAPQAQAVPSDRPAAAKPALAVQSQQAVARTVTPPKVASAAAPAAQPAAAANPAPAGDGLPF